MKPAIAFGLLVALAWHGCFVDAAISIRVDPSNSITVGQQVSIICTTDNNDASKIEVFYAGTRCRRGCEEIGRRRDRCAPVYEECSVSPDGSFVTIQMSATENLNKKTLRCSFGAISSSTITMKVKVPPQIEMVPSKVKVGEGASTTLFCQIRSIVDINVQWWHNGESIQTSEITASTNRLRSNATHELIRVSPANAGSYYCMATPKDDPESSVASTPFDVVVVQPPSLVTLTQDQTGTSSPRIDVDQKPVYLAEDSIAFNCEATTSTDSVATISYYKKLGDSQTKQLLLRCEAGNTCSYGYDVQAEDIAASILCAAENEATVLQDNPVYSAEYSFSVVRTPSSIKPTLKISGSESLETAENSAITVECSSTAPAVPAIAIELLQGEKVFGTSSSCSYKQMPDGKLTTCDWQLTPADTSREYNKRYYCRSSHLASTDESEQLQIRFAPDGITINPPGPSKTYKIEDEVKIECRTGSSNPVRRINWSRNDGTYVDSDGGIPENGEYQAIAMRSTVTFLASRSNDGEVYTCTIDDTDKQQSLLINVNYPPDISISASTDATNLGDEVILSCKTSDGKPDVTAASSVQYIWDKQPIDDILAPWTSVATGEDLRIVNASVTDTATYRCTVKIPESGENSDSYEMRVQHKPMLAPAQPDRFVLNAASCENAEEENVCARIALRIYSEPARSSCEWERNDEMVSDATQNMLLQPNDTHCVLIVRSIKGDGSVLGRYTLTATNSLGNGTFTVSVQEPSAPEKPADVVARSNLKSCNVEWTSRFSGGYQQRFRLVANRMSRRPTGLASINMSVEDSGFGTRVSAKLRPLELATKYEIGVTAINDNPTNRESETAWVTCTTTALPKLSATIGKTASSDDTVIIRFGGDQKPPSTLRTVLQYCKKTDCNSTSISELLPVTLGVRLSFEELLKQYTFALQLFDETDLVLNVSVTTVGAAASREKPKPAGMQTEVLIGIAIGGIFIAILFITCTIFLLRRKHAPPEGVSRAPRRSSSEDDQNQVNKPLMKDNGAMQPGSPRTYSDSARRNPNPNPNAGNFKKAYDEPQNKSRNNNGNNNNNNNNHATSRNVKTARGFDCEMAEFEAKQALVKVNEAEEADTEECRKKDFHNSAFESTEKSQDRHDDIMKAVLDIGEKQNEAGTIEAQIQKSALKNATDGLNEDTGSARDSSRQKVAPAQNQRSLDQTEVVDDAPPPPKPRNRPSNDLSSPTESTAISSPGDSDIGPKPPPRKPKRIGSSADEAEGDSRFANEAAKPVFVAMTKNGVQATVV